MSMYSCMFLTDDASDDDDGVSVKIWSGSTASFMWEIPFNQILTRSNVNVFTKSRWIRTCLMK